MNLAKAHNTYGDSNYLSNLNQDWRKLLQDFSESYKIYNKNTNTSWKNKLMWEIDVFFKNKVYELKNKSTKKVSYNGRSIKVSQVSSENDLNYIQDLLLLKGNVDTYLMTPINISSLILFLETIFEEELNIPSQQYSQETYSHIQNSTISQVSSICYH